MRESCPWVCHIGPNSRNTCVTSDGYVSIRQFGMVYFGIDNLEYLTVQELPDGGQ